MPMDLTNFVKRYLDPFFLNEGIVVNWLKLGHAGVADLGGSATVQIRPFSSPHRQDGAITGFSVKIISKNLEVPNAVLEAFEFGHCIEEISGWDDDPYLAKCGPGGEVRVCDENWPGGITDEMTERVGVEMAKFVKAFEPRA